MSLVCQTVGQRSFSELISEWNGLYPRCHLVAALALSLLLPFRPALYVVLDPVSPSNATCAVKLARCHVHGVYCTVQCAVMHQTTPGQWVRPVRCARNAHRVALTRNRHGSGGGGDGDGGGDGGGGGDGDIARSSAAAAAAAAAAPGWGGAAFRFPVIGTNY